MIPTEGLALYNPEDTFRFTLENPLLSHEQRRFYEENGYVVIKNLVPGDKLDKYR